ncbi:MAG: UvrB/UvrC motif-containing protein [Pilosibacter sp.]
MRNLYDSRFGCPDCYSVFGSSDHDNIRHLQGSEKHVGKRPAGYWSEMEEMNGTGTTGDDPEYSELSKEEKIRLMETRLKDAVRREEYEEAAKLRDEIRALKEERQNG